jgi:hypothetical protein
MSDVRNPSESAALPHQVNGAHNPHVRHERTDVNTRAVLWFVVALAGGLVVVMLVLGAVFALFMRAESEWKKSRYPLAAEQRGQTSPGDRLPPDPRLEGLSAQGLRQPPGRVIVPDHEASHDMGRIRPGSTRDRREQQERELTSYGWVKDKTGQVAHIPIDVAIDRVAAKLPARKPREDGP